MDHPPVTASPKSSTLELALMGLGMTVGAISVALFLFSGSTPGL